MFAVDWQYGSMVSRCQLTNQFSCHHQRLFVGQGDGLVGLDGVDGRRKSCEAYHSGEYDIDGNRFDNLVESLCSCINLDIGHVT